MSEIERAIAYWEEFEREIDEMPHSEILEAQREPVRTALRILRAELDREKNPLTCDGCLYSYSYGTSKHCDGCIRNHSKRVDNYYDNGKAIEEARNA